MQIEGENKFNLLCFINKLFCKYFLLQTRQVFRYIQQTICKIYQTTFVILRDS